MFIAMCYNTKEVFNKLLSGVRILFMDNTKTIRFRSLIFQSLPEMWSFQIITAIVMSIPVFIVKELIGIVINSSGSAFTSANFMDFILSWRFPIFLILGIVLIIIFIIMEIFAQIFLTNDILKGNRAMVKDEIIKSFKSIPSFRNTAGILIFLFIFLAVPLCGIGFSISLTRTLYIPNFIMDVVEATPLYAVLYSVVILALFFMGFRYIFSLHAILLDKQTPSEAMKTSKDIIQKHRGQFIKEIFKDFIIIFLLIFLVALIFRAIPENLLTDAAATLPQGQKIYPEMILNKTITETDRNILFYRFLCSLTVLMSGYLISITTFLSASYLMLKITKLYRDYTTEPQKMYPERPKKSRYFLKIIQILLVFVIVIVLSVVIAVIFNSEFDRKEPVNIIAHRAGGTMASENSLEGLYAAIEHDCYGSEIDVQRTKDNYYIINHDTTFKRLTGVDKMPKDMTLEEVMELRIRDTTGNGNLVKVATFEEMLVVIKGKEKLFIELKGESADQKTADDLIAIIRERNCENDVAFISLNYSIINYIETNYPEFETGTLFFIGVGDVTQLNCDLLIMEEEIATDTRINLIHNAGKKAVVWTVNTSEGMYRFLDSKIDAIITDEVILSEETQAKLDNRNDLQVIQDKLGDFWD